MLKDLDLTWWTDLLDMELGLFSIQNLWYITTVSPQTPTRTHTTSHILLSYWKHSCGLMD